MNLVIDTNIWTSTLIRQDGTSREISRLTLTITEDTRDLKSNELYFKVLTAKEFLERKKS